MLNPYYVSEVAAFCKKRGLGLHIDGARLFNAAVELNMPVSEVVKEADSVTFCLSKGLGAPVGSMLSGTKAFIQKHVDCARFGWGMRQVGILAAAGIYALEHHVERLRIDHVRAKQLASGISELPGVQITRDTPPHTNIIFFALDDTVEIDTPTFLKKLAEKGILIMDVGPREFRMVTHLEISDEGVEQCLQAFKDVLG